MINRDRAAMIMVAIVIAVLVLLGYQALSAYGSLLKKKDYHRAERAGWLD